MKLNWGKEKIKYGYYFIMQSYLVAFRLVIIVINILICENEYIYKFYGFSVLLKFLNQPLKGKIKKEKQIKLGTLIVRI